MTAHPRSRPVSAPSGDAGADVAQSHVPTPERASYALRVLPTWPYHRSHIGDVISVGRDATAADAERVRAAMVNGAFVEVVRVGADGQVVT